MQEDKANFFDKLEETENREIQCLIHDLQIHQIELEMQNQELRKAQLELEERNLAEERVRTYQERLRSLASELSLTEERERRRIATELHDYIGQTLAISNIKLGELRELSSSSDIGGRIDYIRELIEQAIQHTRSLTCWPSD